MKPQHTAVAACLAVVMVVTLYASFVPRAHVDDDEPVPPSLHAKATAHRPAGAIVRVDAAALNPPPQAAVERPPEENDDRDAADESDGKSSDESTALQNDTRGLPPLHITGRWTEDLHAVQLELMAQVAGAWDSSCNARLQRPADPPAKGSDVLIRQRLFARQACNGLLNKVTWTRQDLLRELSHFVREVYPRRPITFNRLGMRLTHAFGAYFVAKTLQPEYIIENGVHLGQSTWLFRQAAPNAKIYSLDPRADMQYWDPKATYYAGSGGSRPGYDVHPFRDFAEMDWSFIVDKDKALVLFDDHQNMLRRVRAAHRHGFRRLMSDDNWSPLQGDNYSVKQICDESGGHALRDQRFPSQRVLMTDNFHMADRFISIEEHRRNRDELLQLMTVYWEMPPVLFVPCQMEYTQFGHTPRKDNPDHLNYVLPRPSHVLLKWIAEAIIAPPVVQSQAEFAAAGLKGLGKDEFLNYANFAYIELA